MNEMHDLLAAAWEKVREKVESDPGELERRLERGRRLAGRPPRAWCLAVRACDTRLWRFATRLPDGEHANEVVLDWGALGELCERVYARGDSVEELAGRLGVTRWMVHKPRVDGVIGSRYLEGGRGKPRPILSATGALDPAARSFEVVDDALWGFTTEDLVGRLWPGFKQVLVRVPRRQKMWGYRDIEGLHPEHPEVAGKARKKIPRRLPPAAKDYVWYKWKGDQFMGCDWRNPLALANYRKRQERLARNREAGKRRRREKGLPYQYCEPMQFKGYRWICPGCGKTVRVVYLPVMGVNLLGSAIGEKLQGEVPMSVGFREEFACEKCHRIRWKSCAKDWWNEVVTCLSLGMLYGREVERPGWFKVERRREFRPMVNGRVAVKRGEVEKRLMEGKMYKEIARETGMTVCAVRHHAWRIYGQKARDEGILRLRSAQAPGRRNGGEEVSECGSVGVSGLGG